MILSSPHLPQECEASPGLIRRLVQRLTTVEHDPFLIMEAGPCRFIQAWWHEDGFDLEYQDGSLDEQYVAVRRLTPNETVGCLHGYLRGDADWGRGLRFRLMDLSRNPLPHLPDNGRPWQHRRFHLPWNIPELLLNLMATQWHALFDWLCVTSFCPWRRDGQPSPALRRRTRMTRLAREIRRPTTRRAVERAARQLCAMGNDGIRIVIDHLRYPGGSYCAHALAEQGTGILSDLLRATAPLQRGHADAAVLEMGAPAIPLLAAALDGPDANAAHTILLLFGERSVHHLVGQLEHADPDVRATSAAALGQLRHRAAAACPSLMKATEDPDHRVARNALVACADIQEALDEQTLSS